MQIHINTKQGIKRKSNQDAISFNDNFINGKAEFNLSEDILNHNNLICILADGMGGYSGGDFASNFTIREIYKDFLDNPINLNVEKCLNRIDDELIQISRSDKDKSGMGTTVVSAIIKTNHIKGFNVGDSCLYHISDGFINKRSTDDNLPGMDKSMITQCIGNYKQSLNIHSFDFDWKKNDFIVMLSDGVSDYMSKTEILNLVNSDCQNKAKILCEKAVNLGSTDDVSALVILNGN